MNKSRFIYILALVVLMLIWPICYFLEINAKSEFIIGVWAIIYGSLMAWAEDLRKR